MNVRSLLPVPVLLLVLATAPSARAQEAESTETIETTETTVPTTPIERTETVNDRVQPTSAGWLVLALGFVLGAGLTGGSATVTCDEPDTQCARWASLGLWGGVGIASLGAVVGILMVEADVRAARRRPAVRASGSTFGGKSPGVMLSVTF